MKPSQSPFCVSVVVSALCLVGGVLPPARGQTAPAGNPPPGPPAEEVVKMDAFSVKTDLGRYAEDTSSMATKVPTKMREIAGSLQILNDAAISDRKALTLQDIYPYVVGMAKVSNLGVGFTLRGFDMNATTTQNVQIDGLQGSTSSKSALSTANVERLEILKGPNSVLYGLMKPGGLVNIVTKSPKEQRSTTLFGSIATYGGTNSGPGDDVTYIGRLDTTGPIDAAKHVLYRLVVVGQDQKTFRKGVYDRDFYLYPSMTYQWSPQTSLTLRGEFITEKRQSDDGLLTLNNDVSLVAKYDVVYQEPIDVDRDYGEAASLAFRTQFGNWTVRVNGRSTWHVDTRRAIETNGLIPVARTPLENSTIARRYRNQKNGHRYHLYDANAFAIVGPKQFQHTVIFGAGGGKEYIHTTRLAFGPTVPATNLYKPGLGTITSYPADGTGTNSPETRRDMFGIYASDRVNIGERLHLSLGARYDRTKENAVDLTRPQTPLTAQDVKATVWQAGVVYDLTGPLSGYASWSQGFNPNSVTVVDASGRSGFDPEKGEQYEVGLKFETSDNRFRASFAAYQIKKTNVLVNTGQSQPVTGLAINRFDGEQTSDGVEVQAEWLPVPYWQVQVGWANMHAFISESSNAVALNRQLSNAPRNSGNFWTRYNFPTGGLKGFGVGTGVIYVGRRFGGDPTGVYFPLPGYTRVDTAFYYRWRNYDFALNVQNVFDRQFIESARNTAAVDPGAPRKLTFSVNARF